jgi:hypothetical protein
MTSLPATKPTGPYELYAKAESTPFTFEAFAVTDPVQHLVCSFGDTVRPREEIDESRGDRGGYAEVLGDYVPIPWSIETRLWGSGTAGTAIASRKALLEAAAGLDYNLYSTTIAIVVDAFANGAGDDFVVTIIDEDGTATVTTIEESVDYDAAVSDEATATSLAAAIHALTGVTAAAATDTVTVTLDTGYRDVDIPNPDATFVTITAGDNKVLYSADDANPATTASLYRVDRQGLLGEYLIGCICQQIVLNMAKGEAPKLTYSGLAARKWEFMATTLGAEIVAAGTLTMTLANPKRLRTGTDATSESGLEIYVKIESEVIKITAMNWTTGVATIVRGQFGTDAAAHANSLAVTPYNEAPTFGEAGEVIGPHDWTLSDGAAVNVRAMQVTLETGRMYDELQSGSSSRDGLNNGKSRATGSLTYILDQSRHEYGRDMDAGTELDLVGTGGSTAGSIFTIDLNHVRLIDGVPKDLAYDEVLEVTLPFRGRDTQAALVGQLNIAMT